MSEAENRANLEKYLTGAPLNEELAQLKDGRLHEFGPQLVAGPEIGQGRAPVKASRPLTKGERIGLKELRQGPGWAGLQRILERATQIHRESAILLSQDDPLGKAKEISQAWAYFNTFKRAHAEINLLIEAEIAELDGKPKEETA